MVSQEDCTFRYPNPAQMDTSAFPITAIPAITAITRFLPVSFVVKGSGFPDHQIPRSRRSPDSSSLPPNPNSCPHISPNQP